MTISPIRLAPWMEVLGQLHELKEQDGYIEASIGPTIVDLPSELKEKLKNCIGQRIGILRTDSDYIFRVMR